MKKQPLKINEIDVIFELVPNGKIPTNDSRDLNNKNVNPPMSRKGEILCNKIEKATCDNCHFFDNSNHVNDPRTKHAGICSKWSEVVFHKDSCKFYLNQDLEQNWHKLIAPRLHENQISLF